ncbi:DUF4422 domain-containing protein [Aerococcus mictus]|uniref:DUF4422 domain-containing protein n=1 Tax=Aerococcus mictus TaxID=2976810 RepID=UPI0018A733B6|nr:DUF4422 domain-containing protein [Aerococcus mictus]
MDEYTVKIVIATHKKYQMPEDSMYIPLHVGAEGKRDSNGNEIDLGYIKDNTGENISIYNDFFCELTGLYWAWKNLSADYIGIFHYRRHFSMNKKILEYKQLKPFLGKIKLFVPKKRWYVIETLKSHYAHTHHLEHLDVTRNVISKKYPDYLKNFDKIMNRRWGYMFNMMIAEYDFINAYCSWVFDVLFDVFSNIDFSNYSVFEKRFIGRVSELLFNVWLNKAIEDGLIKKSEIMELDCAVEENMFIKIPEFLKAKYLGKKYGSSF